MDIMTAFPRSVFSESELEACHWFANKCSASDLPSVQAVKAHRKHVMKQFGAGVKTHEGSMDNVFSVLDLSHILVDVRFSSC